MIWIYTIYIYIYVHMFVVFLLYTSKIVGVFVGPSHQVMEVATSLLSSIEAVYLSQVATGTPLSQ